MSSHNDNLSSRKIRDELKATFERYGINEADVFSDSKSTGKSVYTSKNSPDSSLESSYIAINYLKNNVNRGVSEKSLKSNLPLGTFSSASVIPTGIVGLDSVLAGGFTNHSIVLICGEIGSNFDVFVAQILFNQLIAGGKVAYYLSDHFNADLIDLMDKFGWTLKEYLDNNSWRFINVSTNDLEQLAKLSPGLFSGQWVRPLSGLNGLKNDVLNNIKDGCIVSLELSRLLSNFAASRVIGGVHFIVLPAGVHSEAEVNALKHLADAVLEFRVTEGTYEYENTLVVSKMKGLFKPLKLPFVVNENGISIETVSRIS